MQTRGRDEFLLAAMGSVVKCTNHFNRRQSENHSNESTIYEEVQEWFLVVLMGGCLPKPFGSRRATEELNQTHKCLDQAPAYPISPGRTMDAITHSSSSGNHRFDNEKCLEWQILVEILECMSRGKTILVAICFIFGVTMLLPLVRHYQLRAATEAYKAELRAKGEPMDLAQVLPLPVPPDQDGSGILLGADELFDKSLRAENSLLETNFIYGMRIVAPGKAMVRWQQPDIRDLDGTNTWGNPMAAVAQNAKAFSMLWQIIEKPNFAFPIKYDQGVAGLDFTNLHLADSKRTTLRLETAALCALHQNDLPSAVTNLRTILAVAKAMRNERLVISELVRIAIANIALTVNWEILQAPNLTDRQLASLQDDWSGLDFIQPEENVLAMEHVTGEISLAKQRGFNSELQNVFDLESRARESLGLFDDATLLSKAKTSVKIFMWRYWWSYPDESRALQGYDVLMDTVRFTETNGSFAVALQAQDARLDQLGISKLPSEFDSLLSGKTDFHSLLSESIITLAGVSRKVMRMEVAKQMTVTAIALKRHQLKHGNYPPDLNALVPEFVSAVPLDPVDGKQLRYRPKPDGTFLIYSVAENGKDDGGDPSLEKGVTSSSHGWQNPHALDWLWPQPATEEEIQTYFKTMSAKSN